MRWVWDNGMDSLSFITWKFIWLCFPNDMESSWRNWRVYHRYERITNDKRKVILVLDKKEPIPFKQQSQSHKIYKTQGKPSMQLVIKIDAWNYDKNSWLATTVPFISLFFSIITFTLCKYNHEEVFMLAFFPACLFSWYYFYYHKFWTQSDWYEWDALRSWYDKNFSPTMKNLKPLPLAISINGDTWN